jgi:RNA polymerase sigma factor (sigma-70 family)
MSHPARGYRRADPRYLTHHLTSMRGYDEPGSVLRMGAMGVRLAAVGTVDAEVLLDAAQEPAACNQPDYARMLAAIAAGDPQAETELVKTLTPPLRLVLRRRAAGADIDDLQQETLMIVLAAAREGRVKQPRALVQFALETARRLIFNAKRKVVRQRTESDDEEIEATLSFDPDHDELIAQETLQLGVHQALAELRNPRDRQLLYSYYLDDEPTAVLQVRFAMSSSQLGKVLYRARQRFIEVWRKMRPDGIDP